MELASRFMHVTYELHISDKILSTVYGLLLVVDGVRKLLMVPSCRGSRLSLCVVNNQPVGNPKRKV
jgi:hypothetical protein